MSDKIKVTICTGTTCYVMGGAELLALEEHLRPELKDRIELEGATCLGRCKDRATGGTPPFARVGGKVITAASIEKLIEAIEAEVLDPGSQAR